jgi:hypothetical protein
MDHRNRQRRLRQCRPYMRRHIVRPFVLMPIARIVLRRQPLEIIRQIAHHVRVRVLLNRQRCRRVLHEHRQQSRLNLQRRNPLRHLSRERIKPFSARRNLQCMRVLRHSGSAFIRVHRRPIYSYSRSSAGAYNSPSEIRTPNRAIETNPSTPECSRSTQLPSSCFE